MPHSRRQLLANAAIAASRVGSAMRWRAVLAVAKGECPEPWCLEWCGVDLEDAADNSAIGDYIEIVVVPFAGWAASGRTLEQQRSRHLPSLLRRRTSRLARGGSKTVSVTVQTPPADCPCSGAERVCVEIYSISADATCGV